MNELSIARLAHEVNRAYCTALGDASQPAWEDAPQWQRDSAINGVKFHLANPGTTPEGSHASWLAEKEAAGWIYGEVKDAEKKTHPCMLPYAELPQAQRVKDYLFGAVVATASIKTLLVPSQTGEVWLKHGDHFAVTPYEGCTGILYLPEGSQLVHAGDVIVRDADGFYRVGNAPAAETDKVRAITDDDGLDLGHITSEDLASVLIVDETPAEGQTVTE
jgi:hypothetical protein